MASKHEQPALIVDLGGFETKFGLYTQENPIVIPTVVSFDLPLPKDHKPTFSVGKEALKTYKLNSQNGKDFKIERPKKPTSTDPRTVLRYPYQAGMVMDWDQLEAIFHFVYENVKQLTNGEPERSPVLITCDPLSPMIHRQGISDLYMEYFNCEKLFIEAPGVLSMRQKGNYKNLSGIAVSSGSAFTSLTPVLNNKPFYASTINYPVAGQVLSSYILELIQSAGYEISPENSHRVAQHIKKNMTYTALDINAEFNSLRESPEEYVQELEIPNSEPLQIGGEAFKVVEAMFQPQLIGIYDSSSVQKSIYELAQKFKPENRASLYNNIVLSGGNTLFHNFLPRLRQELVDYLNNTNDSKFTKSVRVTYSSGDVGEEGEIPETTSSVWYSGKKWITDEKKSVTSIDWITRSEYLEEGSRVLFRKCF